jgi:hypothetical protein
MQQNLSQFKIAKTIILLQYNNYNSFTMVPPPYVGRRGQKNRWPKNETEKTETEPEKTETEITDKEIV